MPSALRLHAVLTRRARAARALPLALLGTLLGACHRSPPPTVAVEPLQLFGAEPALMPRLGFEPLAGVLTVRAEQPVYVTVVEVDPVTQARTVVYPEREGRPLRVSGEMSLQLALHRDADPLPARGVLVIASADSLVVASPGADARDPLVPRSWDVPEQMPDLWAAVYVWRAPRRGSPLSGAH